MFAMFIRVIIVWLYYGSGRSVLIVGLFEGAFDTTNGQRITPEQLHLPEGLASVIPSVAVMVFAALLVAFTRGRLSYEPEHAERRPAESGGTAARPTVR